MRVDQIEAALTEGMGDIIAYGIVVTPEREKRVAFSTPIQTDITQIIVTGSNFGPVSTLADLGGKEVYVNPLTTYLPKSAEGERGPPKGRQEADRDQSGRQEPDGRRSDADGECRIDSGYGHDQTTGRPLVASAAITFSRILTW